MMARVRDPSNPITLKLSVILGLMLFAYWILPRVEGSVFPVVGPFTVVEVRSLNNGWTELSGTFDKLRYCGQQAAMFIVETDQKFVVVGHVFADPLRTTEPGPKTFGPWQLQVPASELPATKVVFDHQCHPFYRTRTETHFVFADRPVLPPYIGPPFQLAPLPEGWPPP